MMPNENFMLGADSYDYSMKANESAYAPKLSSRHRNQITNIKIKRNQRMKTAEVATF